MSQHTWGIGVIACSQAMLLLTALFAQGQTNESSYENVPQRLDINIQRGEMMGRDQVVRYFINSGTNQFLFVLPPNTRSEGQNPETLVLAGTDGPYFLSFRILGFGPADADPDKASARKEAVLDRYVGARNIEDFVMNVAGREAQGIQLRQELPAVGQRLVRVLLVPCRAGLLEFTINTDSRKAALANLALSNLLGTFQSNENGKIRIVPRSNQT